MSNSKTFEKKVNLFLTKLTYAALEDITKEWNGDIKYPQGLYNHYDNIIKDPKQQTKLKAVFSLADGARQIFHIVFVKMMEELAETPIDIGDTIDGLAEKMTADDSFTSHMINIGKQHLDKFGPVLLNCTDNERWFIGRIVGYLPDHASKTLVMTFIGIIYENFLKSIALQYAKLLWYTQLKFNQAAILGLLFQNNMSVNMLDDIESDIRIKIPKSKPAAKPAVTELTGADSAIIPQDDSTLPGPLTDEAPIPLSLPAVEITNIVVDSLDNLFA